jgi:hypothetical protein
MSDPSTGPSADDGSSAIPVAGSPGDGHGGDAPGWQGLRSFAAFDLDAGKTKAWREFRESLVAPSYRQNPGWADVERTQERWLARRPVYSWSESQGALALTAVIFRRTLPFPGKYFYDIPKGPLFASLAVFEEWLSWALPRMESDGVRITLAPQWELEHGGDEVETVLERAGFTRCRVLGGWATLILDIDMPEEAVLQSFRRQARQAIRKCQKAGMKVAPDDSAAGRRAFAALIEEMAERTPNLEILSESALRRASLCWFSGGKEGTLLLARSGSDVVAGALVVKQGARAYLVSLPSSRGGSGLPTSHLIVWEAIRWAKSHDCTTFDLEGYNLVAREGDPLWGVNQFKRGFAPGILPTTYVAVHEKIVRPFHNSILRLAERAREVELIRDISRRLP